MIVRPITLDKRKENWKKRIKHKDSTTTNNTGKYLINKHSKSYKHTFNFRNIKILDTETNYRRKLTSEMVHININKPAAVNRNENTQILD